MMVSKLPKVWKFLKMVSIKSVYVNFRYFPVKTALKFPILISRNVVLKSLKGSIEVEGPLTTGMICIGYGDVSLFDRKRSKTIIEVLGRLRFLGKASIGHGSKLSVSETGNITFGNNFQISAESSLVCYHSIEFGDNCLISWDVLFMDTDLHVISDTDGIVLNHPKPILVGANVWVGCRSTVLKGTSIASGSIIAAGSVVSKKLMGENSIYGGVPLRILKEGVFWQH